MEHATLRLQQHLGDARSSRCIAVDRKDIAFSARDSASRISQERIIRGMSNKAAQMKIRCVTIAKARVIVDEVGTTPLRVLPVWLVNSPIESDSRRGCQHWCLVWRYLIFGVKRDEVGGVPMVRLSLVKVLEPLLQLAMLADLQRRQAISCVDHFNTQLLIDAKRFRSLNAG